MQMNLNLDLAGIGTDRLCELRPPGSLAGGLLPGMALSKAGLETYTQEILHHSLNKGDFSKAGYIGRSYLKGKRKLFYKKIFLINKNIGGSINTRAYLINEKKFIRNVDLVIKKTGNKK